MRSENAHGSPDYSTPGTPPAINYGAFRSRRQYLDSRSDLPNRGEDPDWENSVSRANLPWNHGSRRNSVRCWWEPRSVGKSKSHSEGPLASVLSRFGWLRVECGCFRVPFFSHRIESATSLHARYSEANKLANADPFVRLAWMNMARKLLGRAVKMPRWATPWKPPSWRVRADGTFVLASN